MKNVFLSNCLIVYIENEVAKKISLDSIIIDFESMKNIEQNFIDLEFIYEIKVFYVIFNLSSPKFIFFFFFGGLAMPHGPQNALNNI
jgi:hypothetical protein